MTQQDRCASCANPEMLVDRLNEDGSTTILCFPCVEEEVYHPTPRAVDWPLLFRVRNQKG